MDFREASDRLIALGVSLQEQAAALGLSYQTIRAMRLERDATGYRTPPPEHNWCSIFGALAKERGNRLARLSFVLTRRRSLRYTPMIDADLSRTWAEPRTGWVFTVQPQPVPEPPSMAPAETRGPARAEEQVEYFLDGEFVGSAPLPREYFGEAVPDDVIASLFDVATPPAD